VLVVVVVLVVLVVVVGLVVWLLLRWLLLPWMSLRLGFGGYWDDGWREVRVSVGWCSCGRPMREGNAVVLERDEGWELWSALEWTGCKGPIF
jgi:hypothetical protein